MIASSLLAVVVLMLVAGLLISQKKAKSLSSLSWDDLVARLQPVNTQGIRKVAIEYLNPTKGQIDTEPNELWEMIGGEAGLQAMKANAEVLIALAACAQAWNHAESVIVAERMRRDAIALRRAVTDILKTLENENLSGAFYVHEAASAYYLMRQRLLALYETSHVGRYPVLANAV